MNKDEKSSGKSETEFKNHSNRWDIYSFSRARQFYHWNEGCQSKEENIFRFAFFFSSFLRFIPLSIYEVHHCIFLLLLQFIYLISYLWTDAEAMKRKATVVYNLRWTESLISFTLMFLNVPIYFGMGKKFSSLPA